MDRIWEFTLVVALVAAWVILLLNKWGVIEWLQVHGNVLVSKAASCVFCLSWWVCVAVSLVLFILTGDWSLVFAPVLATPITMKMV